MEAAGADLTLKKIVGLIQGGSEHPKGVPLKHFHIDVSIVNGIASISITQEYQNEGENPIETSYFLPVDPDIVISALEFTIGDRHINCKIEEKEVASEKYDDAVAGGKGAVLAKYVEEQKDALSVQVGNILPGQRAVVSIGLVKLLQGS